MRIDRLQAEFDIDVQYIQFPLHPDTPLEGLTLEQLFAGRPIDIEASQQRLAALMSAEGLPFGKRTMTYNSRLAQELGKWGEQQPGGDRIHDVLFRTYFTGGKNLAERETLLDVVRQLDLPEDSAREVLDRRTMKAAVDRDWARAGELGVTGVPTFVFDNRGVVGAQPYEVLTNLVAQGR